MLHPPKSREKINFLIMSGGRSHRGTCIIFYDLTDVTTAPHVPAVPRSDPEPLRQLSHIPVYKQNRIMLVNVADTH